MKLEQKLEELKRRDSLAEAGGGQVPRLEVQPARDTMLGFGLDQMNVTVARVRNLTIGLLYADPLRPDQVWEMVQDFVARNLTATEGARA